MASADSDAGYQGMTSAGRVLAPSSTGAWMLHWFRVWRWPAGVVAGVVLWLALVAVVGAAPGFGSTSSRGTDCPRTCRLEVNDYNADVINMPYHFEFSMLTS